MRKYITIGDVCKVTKTGDLVLVKGYRFAPHFLEAINLKTNQIHHYRKVELETI